MVLLDGRVDLVNVRRNGRGNGARLAEQNVRELLRELLVCLEDVEMLALRIRS